MTYNVSSGTLNPTHSVDSQQFTSSSAVVSSTTNLHGFSPGLESKSDLKSYFVATDFNDETSHLQFEDLDLDLLLDGLNTSLGHRRTAAGLY